MDSGASSEGVSVYADYRKRNNYFNKIFNSSKFTLDENDKLLVIGCGSGEEAKFFVENTNVSSIVAFDISSEMIKYAKLNYSHPKIAYEVADAGDISSWKKEWQNEFTKVISMFALHYIEDLNVIIENIRWCMKPGGVGWILYPIWENLFPLISSGIIEQHPKWSQYFVKDFKYLVYMHFPKNDYPDITEVASHYLKLLNDHDFVAKKCSSLRVHQIINSSESMMKDFIRSILDIHFRRVPSEHHKEFLDDILRESLLKFPDHIKKEGSNYQYYVYTIDALFEKKLNNLSRKVTL